MLFCLSNRVREPWAPSPRRAARHLPRAIEIRDRRLVDRFDADHTNPYLVSFPRTGSHWLQMLMERYFKRPSLHLVYYYPERFDYLTRHVSDLDLGVERRNVLYLYRDPVDTIYSQLRYTGEPVDSREHIGAWTRRYAAHLDKWLVTERFTERKTAIRYEGLHSDLPAEFSKICSHFDQPLDEDRLLRVAGEITKWVLKQKAPREARLVDLAEDYAARRRQFRAQHGDWLWTTLLEGRPHLYPMLEEALEACAA
ncbi:MAG: hypothetical protein HKN82_18310 [Akkermansiaceae bacterium]|nr:hypothetical protein [Akkermansiaceae bacterium]NNM29771.1 hypothetical protein [Akkermansiaceae bacterium]